jgi:tetratricopeptide (TPR) repeat protein
MMRFSRLGVFVFISITVLLGANCSYYNQVFARKDLVDGSSAYKGRKFKEAEELFRAAVARDPKGETTEGKMAQLFLARTLHSQYIGNRNMTFGEIDFLGDLGLGLATKIWAKADPVSQFLFDQISSDTQTIYSNYTTLNPGGGDLDGIKRKNDLRKSFLSALAVDLNKVINSGQSIYDQARFGKVTMSEFTKQFMAGQPTGDKLVRLNRLLLEDAYPKEIAKKPKAEEAIAEYQKALAQNPNDQSSYKAIASLYENLQRNDDWLKLVTERANNTSIPPEQRAEALTSLAAKKNTCANNITDTDKTKKTVTKDGKQAFQFVKPESAEEFETLKKCIEEGTVLIDQAVALETDTVKNAKNIDVKSMSDVQLQTTQDLLKVFESARSYKASLLFQAMHLAEMDGRTADRDRLDQEAKAGRARYLELSDLVKKIQAEIDERAAAKEEAVKGNKANKNAEANKK